MSDGRATSTHETRQRILAAGIELFRRTGYTGTGMKQIAQAAGAPFGSIYHFFPGGKAQLGEEVIRSAGAGYGELVTTLMTPYEDRVAATADAFTAAAGTLADLDYADPCPIATVALEVASTDETLRRATAEVFDSWIDRLAAYYAEGGIPAAAARETATSVIALLEGAFMLGRAARSTAPVLAAGTAAAAIVRSALAAG
ncbi:MULTISPECIES: TetR/AcrR family transcriptional regulator [Streptomyces]|uniref:TetR/AcrR family transcriptional regulator n=2 Tax=Streptomyces TaxID=1883 RepID=A0ABS9JE67_9ACTN|nr:MULTISPECIES: TetR/AcrR family transcriptional regulator [Streptomyces]MYU26999.1 TetR family transcriptional regulator [Streptomyces sp. SID7810]CUW25833.1 putative HTH-type transcriptional regulator YxaF [Streptomyces reticuli]AKN71552.1 TetR family transcriptional regulator [Streptomyces sp. PBH53]MCG0063857.1 TetR/AcrR family transcriptional regulator [Streptomyces tricolor]BCM65237.1 putative TetR-family transcriptional regulator [Streptomyces sp. EAS-AB2608]